MTQIAWRQQLAVGVTTIDDDHRRLIEYLNNLDQAINQDDFNSFLAGTTLMQLLEYTREHFAREEMLMEKIGYPELDQHKAEHKRGVMLLMRLGREFSENPTRSSARHLYDFTADWLVNHIIQSDMKIAPFARSEFTTCLLWTISWRT